MNDEEELLAGIQYHGEPGSTIDCKNAIIRLLQSREEITLVRILTYNNSHVLLLTINNCDLIGIKSGFSSGFSGTGPYYFSIILQLLEEFKIEINEYNVSNDILEKMDSSSLTKEDINTIKIMRPIKPSRWHRYIEKSHDQMSMDKILWQEFPQMIPFSIIDPRIIDLAKLFWDDPDQQLLKGYRRLEDIVRKRIGVKEIGIKLFQQAFMGDNPKLVWNGIDKSEQIGRANLFIGAFASYRNPRAHKERQNKNYLHEYLLLNHLYLLENTSCKQKYGSKK